MEFMNPFVVMNSSKQAKMFSLGGNRQNFATVSLFNNEIYIHVRKYFKNDTGNLYPTKKGVALTVPEFRQLESVVQEINCEIRQLGLQKPPKVAKGEKRKTDASEATPSQKLTKRRGKGKTDKQVPLIVVDEVHSDEQERHVLFLLQSAVAEAVLPHITAISQEHCSGCQTDHPSQFKHDYCMMTPWHDQVDIFLPEASRRVDEEKLYSAWMEKVKQTFPDDLPNSVRKFNDAEWRANNLYSTEFLEGVAKMLREKYDCFP